MEIAKEILKKHALSVICGVVILLSVAAYFWPLGSMYTDAQATLNKRKTAYDDLTHVVANKRYWPVTAKGAADSGPLPLTLFPNELRVQAGKDLKDKAHQKALQVQGVVGEPNVHVPLLKDVLPRPSERRFEFRDAYQKMVTVTLPTLLNYSTPPTDAEVHAEADRIWKDQFAISLIMIAGKPVNLEQTIQSWHDAIDDKLEQNMRLDRAMRSKVYLSPEAIAVNRAMLTNPNGPKEDEIWYAQNMLWVEQDLIDAIARINKNSLSVPTSPVKHILRMDIPDSQAQYVTGGTGPTAVDGFQKSPTGRICNTLYDVVQFTLILNVDAHKIPQIITDLERSKLITITNYNAVAVDGIAAADEGYIYGDVPVVKLTMHGEELFLREWTVPLMPGTVKTAMGIPQ